MTHDPDAHTATSARDSLQARADGLPLLISQVDRHGRYRHVNAAYSAWFGRPAEQVVGQSLEDVLGTDAYSAVRPWVAAALAGQAVRFETVLDYRDAGIRHIEATYIPNFDAAGAPDGFSALVQDVTDRKRLAEELAASELRLARVLESVNDGFLVIDREGCVKLINAAAERFCGVTRDQVLGQPVFEVFPALEGSAFAPMVRLALGGEQPSPVEGPSACRPDRRILVRASSIPVGGLTIAFTDITERWEAEAAQDAINRQVQEQLEELEAIYESSPVGLAFLTKELQFVRVNRRLAQMNGLSAADHVGRQVRDVVPEIADQVEAILRRLEAGEEIVSYEVTGETAAAPGVEGAWLEYWTPLLGADGAVRGLNVVVEDITERKRAETRTRLLIDELNHRVKNTLAVVQNLARQSLRGADVPAAARQAFELRLLALAAAHDVLTQRQWDAAGLREVAMTAVGAADARITLSGPEVAVGPDVAVALSLALHELTTNARKYGALSADGGAVEVSWALLPDDRVRLCWSEHGGPAVIAPVHRGFGARLLERAMDGATDGGATLTFAPTGVVCELLFRAADHRPG